ncbi:hypothetical protein PoB_007682100 [Plakobranchus ocellatus]|uniref:Uncharacterized protein n=1 Tax=Plakobranchus ocellatus TaxID=259542 RepID=A0AAV4E1T4_9GAST|nr:hypothetical protein PoB_007682100 [Plakobranchus ocellatus]
MSNVKNIANNNCRRNNNKNNDFDDDNEVDDVVEDNDGNDDDEDEDQDDDKRTKSGSVTPIQFLYQNMDVLMLWTKVCLGIFLKSVNFSRSFRLYCLNNFRHQSTRSLLRSISCIPEMKSQFRNLERKKKKNGT